jgi:hypothetical protein
MARQALIKLRRGTGAPANNVLAEGELAIDIAAKKLYSANSNGNAFTLSGDQYNMSQSGNATHGIITLTVDNTTLSNDSVLITGGSDITVAGNSTVVNVNSTSTLDTVLGRGASSSKTLGVGNTTITGFANVTTTLEVGSTSQFDGAITVGNSTVNAVIAASGNIDTDGLLTVGGNTALSDSLTVADTSTFSGAVTVGNSTVNAVIATSGNINTDGTLTVAGNTAFNGANNEIAGQVNINDTTTSSSVSTGALVVDGGVGIAENLFIGGNLSVAGTTTTVSSTTVTIDDNLIKLAANQTADDTDAVDTGLYSTYDVGGTQKYSGFVRDTSNSNKAFVFFEGITSEPAGTVSFSASDMAYIEAIVDGGTY